MVAARSTFENAAKNAAGAADATVDSAADIVEEADEASGGPRKNQSPVSRRK
jgi:hypothetical protein